MEKPSKIFGEFLGQNDVARDLAHDVNLETVFAALQSVLRHLRDHLAAFLDVRQNGTINLRFVRPISSRTFFMARHSRAKPA